VMMLAYAISWPVRHAIVGVVYAGLHRRPVVLVWNSIQEGHRWEFQAGKKVSDRNCGYRADPPGGS